ncbi:MAG: GTP cyclohydrolase I FolE [Coriobacteriales bacterium]|jgi:GTP cyclohydrolase I
MAVDKPKVEQAIRMLLEAVGEDPEREGLQKTPERVARMYEEILAGMDQDPAEFFEVLFDEKHQEMVLVKDIPLYSICEHHLVPFFGKAFVAYIPGPDGKVCGLSKIARLVDCYAKRPQVQERLTSQIADTLMNLLNANGVMVIIECEHMCMSMRGVKKPGTTTTTSALRGGFKSNPATRAEAMNHIYGQKLV